MLSRSRAKKPFKMFNELRSKKEVAQQLKKISESYYSSFDALSSFDDFPNNDDIESYVNGADTEEEKK